ncbi:hypothetical protein FRC11_001409, partial [Ceratobasidium sp. 423]
DKAVVTQDDEPGDPRALSIRKGETLVLERTDEEHGGSTWWMCSNVNGVLGIALANRVEVTRRPTITPAENESPAPNGRTEHIIALYDYESEEPEELNFKKGDILTVVQRTEGYTKWWLCRKSNGETGVIPSNFVKIQDDPAQSPSLMEVMVSSQETGVREREIALFDFEAERPGDLTMKKGETFIVIDRTQEKCTEWWLCRRLNEEAGTVPSNFVEIKHGPTQSPSPTDSMVLNRVMASGIEATRNAPDDLHGRPNMMTQGPRAGLSDDGDSYGFRRLEADLPGPERPSSDSYGSELGDIPVRRSNEPSEANKRVEIGALADPSGATPSERKDIPINRQMTVYEVISRLIDRGCKDLPPSIALATFADHPVSQGGFSDVYRGRLSDGTLVAVKSLRISISNLSQDSKHLK